MEIKFGDLENFAEFLLDGTKCRKIPIFAPSQIDPVCFVALCIDEKDTILFNTAYALPEYVKVQSLI